MPSQHPDLRTLLRVQSLCLIQLWVGFHFVRADSCRWGGIGVISGVIKMNIRGPSSFQETVSLSRPCSILPNLIQEVEWVDGQTTMASKQEQKWTLACSTVFIIQHSPRTGNSSFPQVLMNLAPQLTLCSCHPRAWCFARFCDRHHCTTTPKPRIPI